MPVLPCSNFERDLKSPWRPQTSTSSSRISPFAPLRRSAKPRVSTYFDTADLALDNAHMSLRVRASGDRIVQTLKRQTAPSSGFSVRMEYEIERAEPVPILRVTSPGTRRGSAAYPR